LRYRTSKNPVPLEFWGCLASNPRVDWASGFVHVTEENLASNLAREVQIAQASSQATPNSNSQSVSILKHQPSIIETQKPD
jgi:hypothetical protein